MTTPQERLRAETDTALLKYEVKQKRRKIVKSVAHSSAMEGMPLSDEMKGQLYAVADGKLTSNQLIGQLTAKHRR